VAVRLPHRRGVRPGPLPHPGTGRGRARRPVRRSPPLGGRLGPRRARAPARGVQDGRRTLLRSQRHSRGRLARQLRSRLGGDRQPRPRQYPGRDGGTHPVRPSRLAALAGPPTAEGPGPGGQLGPAPSGHRLGSGPQHRWPLPAPGRRSRRRHQVHRQTPRDPRRAAGPGAAARARERRGRRVRGALRVPPQARLRPGSAAPFPSRASPSFPSGPTSWPRRRRVPAERSSSRTRSPTWRSRSRLRPSSSTAAATLPGSSARWPGWPDSTSSTGETSIPTASPSSAGCAIASPMPGPS
jgi:hypothetical protein